MDKKEFIKEILKKKGIKGDIFKISLKIDDFPIARQVLKKIKDREEINVILNSKNILEIKSAQANIIGTYLNFIEDSLLKSKSIIFINELVDEKLFNFNNSNNENLKVLEKNKSNIREKTSISNKISPYEKLKAKIYAADEERKRKGLREYANTIEARNNYGSALNDSQTLKTNFSEEKNPLANKNKINAKQNEISEEETLKNSSIENILSSNAQTLLPKLNLQDNEDPFPNISVNEFISRIDNYQNQNDSQNENIEKSKEEPWDSWTTLIYWSFSSAFIGSLVAVFVFFINGGQSEARKNALIIGSSTGLVAAIYAYGSGKSMEKEEELKQST